MCGGAPKTLPPKIADSEDAVSRNNPFGDAARRLVFESVTLIQGTGDVPPIQAVMQVGIV